MTDQSEWTIDYEIYPWPVDKYPDAYEYMIALIHRPCNKVADEWDSRLETANGIQFLSYEDCLASVNAIRDAVWDGQSDEWFDIRHVCSEEKLTSVMISPRRVNDN